MVVEPDDFPPFVLSEAVLVQEIEGVVPLAMDAEVEDTHAEVVGNVGQVMFGVRGHLGVKRRFFGRAPGPLKKINFIFIAE